MQSGNRNITHSHTQNYTGRKKLKRELSFVVAAVCALVIHGCNMHTIFCKCRHTFLQTFAHYCCPTNIKNIYLKSLY